MRLLMFVAGDGARLGAYQSEVVVDLAGLARSVGAPAPPADLQALIEAGEGGLARARELLSLPAAARRPAARPLSEVTILPPLPRLPGNVLAIGRNYLRHAEEGARLRGTEVQPPTIFTKATTSLVGPRDDIVLDPSISERMDWEVELGVVMGKAAADIHRSRALEHVFGYTVVNDVSARDIQHGWGGQWFKGKSIDGSSPVGPWVVTADEVPDPQALTLRLRVNGEEKQLANTRDMIYPVDAIIEWLSIGMTLPAGSLIATGTPEGVGQARTPPEFLRPGDVMESEIEGLGALRNRCVAAPARAARAERFVDNPS